MGRERLLGGMAVRDGGRCGGGCAHMAEAAALMAAGVGAGREGGCAHGRVPVAAGARGGRGTVSDGDRLS